MSHVGPLNVSVDTVPELIAYHRDNDDGLPVKLRFVCPIFVVVVYLDISFNPSRLITRIARSGVPWWRWCVHRLHADVLSSVEL